MLNPKTRESFETRLRYFIEASAPRYLSQASEGDGLSSDVLLRLLTSDLFNQHSSRILKIIRSQIGRVTIDTFKNRVERIIDLLETEKGKEARKFRNRLKHLVKNIEKELDEEGKNRKITDFFGPQGSAAGQISGIAFAQFLRNEYSETSIHPSGPPWCGYRTGERNAELNQTVGLVVCASGTEKHGAAGASGTEEYGVTSGSGTEEHGVTSASWIEEHGAAVASWIVEHGVAVASWIEEHGAAGASGTEKYGVASASGTEERDAAGDSVAEENDVSDDSGTEENCLDGAYGTEEKYWNKTERYVESGGGTYGEYDDVAMESAEETDVDEREDLIDREDLLENAAAKIKSSKGPLDSEALLQFLRETVFRKQKRPVLPIIREYTDDVIGVNMQLLSLKEILRLGNELDKQLGRRIRKLIERIHTALIKEERDLRSPFPSPT